MCNFDDGRQNRWENLLVAESFSCRAYTQHCQRAHQRHLRLVLLHRLIQQLDAKIQRGQLHCLLSARNRVCLALDVRLGLTVRSHVVFAVVILVTTATAIIITIAVSSGDLLLRGRHQSMERDSLTVVETVRRRLPCVVLLRPDEKCHHLLPRPALLVHSIAVSIWL